MPGSGSTSGSQAFASGGAGPTAVQLIRSLGSRLKEYIPANPTSAGTQTTLIDTGLKQYFPQDISQFYGWISGVGGADLLNVGVERRASVWTQSASTVTLFAPGFPTNITQGPYEIHMRYQRSLILEALNDGIGQLGLTWFREVEDTSLVSSDHVWTYTAPALQRWTKINNIEIQVNTDAQAVAGGYPFAPADYLNPRVDRQVDASGVETWLVRFGTQPPPGRIIRLRGEAYYTDVVQDTDFVPLAGEWQRPALSWIFSWGSFCIHDWTSNQQPTDSSEKTRQRSLDELERQKNQILASAPSHAPGKINVPGMGDGYPAGRADWRYLGALRSAAFTPGGS